MTFTEWVQKHEQEKNKILAKLSHLNTKQLVDYFEYENMKVNEPTFCPLYETNTKCHNLPDGKLNCYFCACPYFVYTDGEPLSIDHGMKVYSKCSIESVFAMKFIWEENGEDNCQCDCSQCFIPHKKSVVLQCLKSLS